MKKFITLGCFFLSFFLFSCQSFVIDNFLIGATGLKDANRYLNEMSGREIIIIPVSHIEKAEYYEEIKYYMDSLKAEGFVIFYEGLGIRRDMDPVLLDTLYRKRRKLTGGHVTEKGYEDENNKALPRVVRKRKYVAQSNERLGLTTDRDMRADLMLVDLVDIYEKERGVVELTSYDFETGLTERYRWREKGVGRKQQKENSHFFLITLRNRYVLESVANSDYDKLVLIYGRGHVPGLHFGLKDLGFQYSGSALDKENIL